AVFDWHYKKANNFGLLVTAETTSGRHVNGTFVRFAQRNEHHDSKQPALVIFAEDEGRKHANFISPEDEGTRMNGSARLRSRQPNQLNSRNKGKSGGRRKRTYDMYRRYRQKSRTCSRYEMFVDFEEIGWSGWIISPNSYNAYRCDGGCPFPLGQSQKPTNHATVQSIVHAIAVGKNVGTPCCVPNKLYSISLLYFDDNENVILKQYDDMVVASCGCH
ncbi:hypothetical protein EGW08_019541, partial [Elysia chlorotica]